MTCNYLSIPPRFIIKAIWLKPLVTAKHRTKRWYLEAHVQIKQEGLPCLQFKVQADLAHLLFYLFITPSDLDPIEDHTKEYSTCENAGKGRPHVKVDGNDIKCFLGIIIFMGVYQSPQVEDDWELDSYGRCNQITKAM